MRWSAGAAAGRPPLQLRTGDIALGLALLTGLLHLLGGVAPAHAQQQDPDRVPDIGSSVVDETTSTARLTVTGLTGVLGPGARPAANDEFPMATDSPDELQLRVLVENIGDAPLDGLRLVVEVHPPTLTRGLLRQALEGDPGDDPVTIRTSPELLDGAPLEVGGLAGVETTFTADDIPWAESPGGVHPIKIAVTRGTTTLDEVVTAVVWLRQAPAAPMLTTMIWPLDTAPWRTTGGAYPDTTGREIRAGGRIDRLLTAAEGARANTVVLAPAAHLLEDLSDRSDGFDSLVRQDDGSLETQRVTAEGSDAALARQTLRRIRELAAVQQHAPISGTYADADLGALTLGDRTTTGLAGMAAIEGRRRVQLQLGAPVDAGVHLVDGPITPAVLDLLPGDTVLLPSRATDAGGLVDDPAVGEPVRTVRTPSGRLLSALIADAYLEASFTSDATANRAGPIVAAQRTVAESAMAYFVSPGTEDRGLILLPPPTWNPSPTTAAAVLDGLERAPWIQLTSPARLASDARYSGRTLDLAASEDGPFRGDLLAALVTASDGLTGLAASLPEPDTRIQGRTLQELEDDLVRSTSRWYRGDATGLADALVRDIQRTIDTTIGDVEVTSGTVTLTSDTGEIPVTLQRTRGDAIQVVVTVESQGRLLWPEGRRSEVLLIEEGTSQTVSFATRALSTGTFPVTVRVTDPSGSTIISDTTLSVRSTAISGVALTGTGLLVAVLLLFGAVRRRDRVRPPLSSVDRP